MTTLADLLVRAHLHRSSFPKCAFHSMSKSVRRVAEAAGTLPQDHDAGGVLAEHAALAGTVDIGPKQFREEQARSEEHTSELQSLMRISYAVFCLKKKKRIPISITRLRRDTTTT